MRLWQVVTPPYEYTEHVCAEGGPTYPVCDVIEIEAETKRDAIALGVLEMLKGRRQGNYGWFNWCRDRRSDGLSPYAGVTAVEVCRSCDGRTACPSCDVLTQEVGR